MTLDRAQQATTPDPVGRGEQGASSILHTEIYTNPLSSAKRIYLGVPRSSLVRFALMALAKHAWTKNDVAVRNFVWLPLFLFISFGFLVFAMAS